MNNVCDQRRRKDSWMFQIPPARRLMKKSEELGANTSDANTDTIDYAPTEVANADKGPTPLHHRKQRPEGSNQACIHGTEPSITKLWCATQNVTVLSDPNHSSLEDEPIYHGLGVTWTVDKT